MPSGVGLVGACARNRRIINVPDCYSDPRFDPGVDKSTGYHTRCMLTLPLIDHKDVLVGVMQVLNKKDGVFDEDDEVLATALAAQCAVALQRVRMTGALIEGEKMRQALEMAREVQMSTLPSTMPVIPGYDVCGSFRPAELTGGDTFDLSLHGHRTPRRAGGRHRSRDRAGAVGDADAGDAAHGVPARRRPRIARSWRSTTGSRATLAADRFITAFVGLLDPATHRLRFHSGGQAPILHYRAARASVRAVQAHELSAGGDAAHQVEAGRDRRDARRATS